MSYYTADDMPVFVRFERGVLLIGFADGTAYLGRFVRVDSHSLRVEDERVIRGIGDLSGFGIPTGRAAKLWFDFNVGDFQFMDRVPMAHAEAAYNDEVRRQTATIDGQRPQLPGSSR